MNFERLVPTPERENPEKIKAKILATLDSAISILEKDLSGDTLSQEDKEKIEGILTLVRSHLPEVATAKDGKYEVRSGGNSQREGVPVDDLIEWLTERKNKEKDPDKKNEIETIIDTLSKRSSPYWEAHFRNWKQMSSAEKTRARKNSQWRINLEARNIANDWRRNSIKPKDAISKRRELILPEILSVEEIKKNAEKKLAIRERTYLNNYRKYLKFLKTKKPKKQEEFLKIKYELNNYQRFYEEALEEYKLAHLNELVDKKKRLIFQRLEQEKRDELKRELTDAEINQIKQKTEEFFEREKPEIIEQMLAVIAYDILEKREELERKKMNIAREVSLEKTGPLKRLWERFKNIPYGWKVVIGSLIAGVGAGTLAVAGGLGFAALGIGATAAWRRFFGGGIIGGSIKGISEYFIKRKEKKQLEKTTKEKIEELSKEISEIINDPDKGPGADYEKWLQLAEDLDKRINEVIKEREKIRKKSNKKRRLWTLLAILAGGLATNYDNIASIFGSGAKAGTEGLVGTDSLGKIGEESLRIDVEAGLGYISPEKLTGIPIGKEGFWGAASKLKEIYGISDSRFSDAWAQSLATDPITGEIFPLPEAHWVKSFIPGQQAVLSYNPFRNVFEVSAGQGIKIGGAEELIRSYAQATGLTKIGNIPLQEAIRVVPIKTLLSLIRGGS